MIHPKQTFIFRLIIAGCSCASAVLNASWQARPEIIAATDSTPVTTVSGVVFNDLNGDGSRQSSESGVGKVLVSNGIDVVATDAQGTYELPVRADMNTPGFRSWFNALVDYTKRPIAERRDAVPPVSINDLADTKLLTPADLAEGTWLTANVWASSAESVVEVSINGQRAIPMERTQSGTGKQVRIGAEWADPFAAQRQLSVARYAYSSESGIERNQGMEVFKGSRFGPAAPQPMGRLADRNGQVFTEAMIFEIRSELPAPRWRSELW